MLMRFNNRSTYQNISLAFENVVMCVRHVLSCKIDQENQESERHV